MPNFLKESTPAPSSIKPVNVVLPLFDPKVNKLAPDKLLRMVPAPLKPATVSFQVPISKSVPDEIAKALKSGIDSDAPRNNVPAKRFVAPE